MIDRLLRNSGLRQNVGNAPLQIVLGLCTAKKRTKEKKCDTPVNNCVHEWFSSGGMRTVSIRANLAAVSFSGAGSANGNLR